MNKLNRGSRVQFGDEFGVVVKRVWSTCFVLLDNGDKVRVGYTRLTKVAQVSGIELELATRDYFAVA